MGSRKKQNRIAKKVDRYDLYIRSVQSPDHEVEFFDEVYTDEFGGTASILREDFCGTFGVCCEWVKEDDDRFAIGVDLDPEPLEWGREHLLSRLSEEQKKRVKLIQDDVRKADETKADVLAAQNFSFWIFKTRAELLEYLKAAYANIEDEGIMIMDMMGGSESIEEDHEDEREIDENPIVKGSPKEFTYIWEQARYDPITHDASFYIHFEFEDNSKMKRAFEYHWRFWTIPEVRELLAEAGFRRTDVYWDVADDEDDDDYQKRESAPSQPSWVSYIVAIK